MATSENFTRIPLSDLDAEFGKVQMEEDGVLVTYDCLWLRLEGTFRMIPFGPRAKQDRVWVRESGSGLDDLTLLPSFVDDGVHGFVRQGHWISIL